MVVNISRATLPAQIKSSRRSILVNHKETYARFQELIPPTVTSTNRPWLGNGCKKEYGGNRAPKVGWKGPGVPKGTWLVIEGLPPVGLSHYSKGLAVGKERGISAVEQNNNSETIRFNEIFRYEDYRAGLGAERAFKGSRHRWRRSRGAVVDACTAHSIVDEPFQRAIFHSYNGWLHEFCSHNPKRLAGLALIPILDINILLRIFTTTPSSGFAACNPDAHQDSEL